MWKKIKENNRKIAIVVIAIFTTIALNMSLNIDNIKFGNNIIINNLTKLNNSLSMDLDSLFMFLGLIFLFSKTFFKKEIRNRMESICKVSLSVLFSIFILIGTSYFRCNSWDLIFFSRFQILKVCIVGTGYYFINRAVINLVFDNVVDKIWYKQFKNKIFNFIFEKHSFAMPLIIILLFWSVYIIAYFPGILGIDSENQIKQFFGLDIAVTSSTNSVKLIDENVKITNHHPVMHTVLLGLCMKFGKLVGNDNLGVFACSIIQIALLSCSFSYTIYFMKKIKTNNYLRIITLIIFSVIPIFPIYALEITKDVPFTAFIIFYIAQLYSLVEGANVEKISVKKIVLIFFTIMGICFLRNNGIYTILLSLPLVCLIDKLNRKKIIFIILAVAILYKSFNSILLPSLKIPGTSVREALSIPFQQTARYVKEHKNEVTQEEKENIDKVLEYNTIDTRYNPQRSDPVKNKYNKDATQEDLSNYLKTWKQQFFKHPTTYIQATLNNYFGYVYPEVRITEFTAPSTIEQEETLNNTKLFKYHYIEKFKFVREVITQGLIFIQKVPILSWIINMAYNVYLLLMMLAYLIMKKKYKHLIVFMPSISIILVCFASPVNAYYRYAISYIFPMALIIGIFLDIIKKKENTNEKELKLNEK